MSDPLVVIKKVAADADLLVSQGEVRWLIRQVEALRSDAAANTELHASLLHRLAGIRESWESWNRGYNRMTDADVLREIGLMLNDGAL